MPSAPVYNSPGYRRRFIITPSARQVCAELEDDYHCMGVRLHHDGTIATQVEPLMSRAPWITCPGAVEVLKQTFTGLALGTFATRGEKRANCTHLHDLAVLAAAHAFDREPLIYDIAVSDPIEGRRRAELRRNGTFVLGWTVVVDRIEQPAHLKGTSLVKLRPWIDSLDHQPQEEARLLRWGTMVANGRTMSLDRPADTGKLPSGNCYTFQPQRMSQIKRTGLIRDFSEGTRQPLDERPFTAPDHHDITHSIRFARRTS